MFASNAPPPAVKIKGASTKITASDMKLEYNGFLSILATLIEMNGGSLSISHDTYKQVVKEGRVIKIVKGELATTLQFDTEQEDESQETENTAEISQENTAEISQVKDFLNSDTAAEAREYLAQQRKEKDASSN